MCVKVMSVCDVEYVWAIVQMYLMLGVVQYCMCDVEIDPENGLETP